MTKNDNHDPFPCVRYFVALLWTLCLALALLTGNAMTYADEPMASLAPLRENRAALKDMVRRFHLLGEGGGG